LDPKASISDRINSGKLVAYAEDLLHINDASTVRELLRALHSVVQRLEPERDWAWLRQIASRIQGGGRRTAVQAHRMRTSHELVALGIGICEDAEASAVYTPLTRALRFRDGLMVALLSLRPLRRTNFSELKLGTTLLPTTDGLPVIDIPAHQTKNGVHIRQHIPALLEPYLEKYLKHYRPLLIGRRGRWKRPVDGALWVSKDGSPMRPISFYLRIVEITGLNPHSFRHCGVSTLAAEKPEFALLAMDLIANKSWQTVERHYLRAERQQANARMQDVIEARRAEARTRMRRLTRYKKQPRESAPSVPSN
jgi:hypothetical protein